MRGEHAPEFSDAEVTFGSSPHAWGTHRHSFVFCPQLRFIPTCVGNTSGWWLCPSRRAVHPHMRGEHNASITMEPMRSGSSPHAWGTRVVSCCNGCRGRFIPTCVGNTYARPGAWVRPPV